MSANVEIKTGRGGWMYAIIRRQRGLERAIVRRLGTKSEEEARALVKASNLEQLALADRADAICRDVWIRMLAGRKIRVRDAIEAFEAHRNTIGHDPATIRREQDIVERWLRGNLLANEPITAVESRHVAEFINAPGPAMYSTRTLQLQAINNLLKYCVARHWLVSNPCLDVVVRTDTLTQAQLISVHHPPFEDDEIALLLTRIPPTDFWHGAILFGRDHGLRLNMVQTLEDSNIVGHQLRVYARKNKRVVNERLSDDVIAWLEIWRTVRPASDMTFLFPAQACLSANQASLNFGRLLKKHGIEGKSFAGLRSAASRRVWNGALKDLGGPQASMLARLVAQHGYARVQRLLAHAEGSTVTATSYLPRAQ